MSQNKLGIEINSILFYAISPLPQHNSRPHRYTENCLALALKFQLVLFHQSSTSYVQVNFDSWHENNKYFVIKPTLARDKILIVHQSFKYYLTSESKKIFKNLEI
jgi:hypothetical protein